MMLENLYPSGQDATETLYRDANCWVRVVFQSQEVILVVGRQMFFACQSLSLEY